MPGIDVKEYTHSNQASRDGQPETCKLNETLKIYYPLVKYANLKFLRP